MPGAGSFVPVDDANIIVSSIKQAEEGKVNILEEDIQIF